MFEFKDHLHDIELLLIFTFHDFVSDIFSKLIPFWLFFKDILFHCACCHIRFRFRFQCYPFPQTFLPFNTDDQTKTSNINVALFLKKKQLALCFAAKFIFQGMNPICLPIACTRLNISGGSGGSSPGFDVTVLKKLLNGLFLSFKGFFFVLASRITCVCPFTVRISWTRELPPVSIIIGGFGVAGGVGLGFAGVFGAKFIGGLLSKTPGCFVGCGRFFLMSSIIWFKRSCLVMSCAVIPAGNLDDNEFCDCNPSTWGCGLGIGITVGRICCWPRLLNNDTNALWAWFCDNLLFLLVGLDFGAERCLEFCKEFGNDMEDSGMTRTRAVPGGVWKNKNKNWIQTIKAYFKLKYQNNEHTNLCLNRKSKAKLKPWDLAN